MAKSILSWDWGRGREWRVGGREWEWVVCVFRAAVQFCWGLYRRVLLTRLYCDTDESKEGEKTPNQKRLTCRIIKHSPAFVSLFNNPCTGLQRKMIWIMIKSKSTYIPPSRLTQFRIFSTAKWDDPNPPSTCSWNPPPVGCCWTSSTTVPPLGYKHVHLSLQMLVFFLCLFNYFCVFV